METVQQRAIQSLSMNSTHTVGNLSSTCFQCGGLLVATFCISPYEGGAEFQIQVMKCFQCGDLIDSAILENRRRSYLNQPNHN